MVYITENYIRLFYKAQTFMRRHRLGAPRGAWDVNRPFHLHRLKPDCSHRVAQAFQPVETQVNLPCPFEAAPQHEIPCRDGSRPPGVDFRGKRP